MIIIPDSLEQELELTEKIPSVSVIVPTFNRAEVLRFAIQTILRQDFRDFEAWIVGDGCTDNSEDVVASFADRRLRWLNLPQNTGSPSVPRSEAIKRARGRFVAYLGHDDLWFPWHLGHLLRHLESGGADFVCSLGALMKPEGVSGVFCLPARSKNPNWTVSPSNWFHKIELIDRAGGWPSSKVWASDMIFLQKIWRTETKLSFTRTLSVLKFTASAWGMYGLGSRFPQQRYAEAILNDPESLRLEILQDTASRISTCGKNLLKNEKPSRTLFKKTVMFFSNSYGIHRWPVNQLMRRYWRKRSGLDSKLQG